MAKLAFAGVLAVVFGFFTSAMTMPLIFFSSLAYLFGAILLPGVLSYWALAPRDRHSLLYALPAGCILGLAYVVLGYFAHIFYQQDVYVFLWSVSLATAFLPKVRGSLLASIALLRSGWAGISFCWMAAFTVVLTVTMVLQMDPAPGVGPIAGDFHALVQTYPVAFLRDGFPLAHRNMEGILVNEGYNTVFHIVGVHYTSVFGLLPYQYSYHAGFLIFIPLFVIMAMVLLSQLGARPAYMLYGIALFCFFTEYHHYRFYQPQLAGATVAFALLAYFIGDRGEKPCLAALYAVGFFLLVGFRLPVAMCVISGVLLHLGLEWRRSRKWVLLLHAACIAISSAASYYVFFKYRIDATLDRMGGYDDISYMMFAFLKSQRFLGDVFLFADHFAKNTGIHQPFRSILLSLGGLAVVPLFYAVYFLMVLPVIKPIWQARKDERHGFAVRLILLCIGTGISAGAVINMNSRGEWTLLNMAHLLVHVLFVFILSQMDLFRHIPPFSVCVRLPMQVFRAENARAWACKVIVLLLMLAYPFWGGFSGHGTWEEKYRSSQFSRWLPYKRFERSAVRAGIFSEEFPFGTIKEDLWNAFRVVRMETGKDAVIVAPDLFCEKEQNAFYVTAFCDRKAYMESTGELIYSGGESVKEEVDRRRGVLMDIVATGLIPDELRKPQYVFLVRGRTGKKIQEQAELEILYDMQGCMVFRLASPLPVPVPGR